MDNTKVGSGLYMASFSSKNVVEDFLKMEYQEGLRNEFAMKDALINRISKDTITGKKKYKSFALGITDNVRAIGRSADRYELGFNDYLNKGVETVEAEFDTTKLMATFSVTDEVLLKGTSDGSLIDVVKDSLDRMQLALSHTMSRFTYGAPDGKIGKILATKAVSTTNAIQPFSLSDVTGSAAKPTWDYPMNKFYSTANGGLGVPKVVEFYMSNSYSVLPGMGLAIDVTLPSPTSTGTVTHKRFIGRIWQKVSVSLHDEKIIMFVDKFLERIETYDVAGNTFGNWIEETSPTSTDLTVAVAVLTTGYSIKVYSRQLDDTAVDPQPEYTGLEAIVINKVDASTGIGEYDTIFGVNRAVYQSLKCTTYDLNGTVYMNEELLRDMGDHLELTSPDGTAITIVAANHRIISAVEKSLYQFKEYSIDQSANGFNLGGRSTIKFDNYQLYKDSFARDNNVYMLDQGKIGELVRRDFQWITSGDAEGVLSRRPGTELYEGIMNKYADMYIDAWRAHAAILNCKVPAVGSFLSYDNSGAPK